MATNGLVEPTEGPAQQVEESPEAPKASQSQQSQQPDIGQPVPLSIAAASAQVDGVARLTLNGGSSGGAGDSGGPAPAAAAAASSAAAAAAAPADMDSHLTDGLMTESLQALLPDILHEIEQSPPPPLAPRMELPGLAAPSGRTVRRQDASTAVLNEGGPQLVLAVSVDDVGNGGDVDVHGSDGHVAPHSSPTGADVGGGGLAMDVAMRTPEKRPGVGYATVTPVPPPLFATGGAAGAGGLTIGPQLPPAAAVVPVAKVADLPAVRPNEVELVTTADINTLEQGVYSPETCLWNMRFQMYVKLENTDVRVWFYLQPKEPYDGWQFNHVSFSVGLLNLKDPQRTRTRSYDSGFINAEFPCFPNQWPPVPFKFVEINLLYEDGYADFDGNCVFRGSFTPRTSDVRWPMTVAPQPHMPRGLQNHGATCYLNVLLQALFHVPSFRHLVYSTLTKEQEATTATPAPAANNTQQQPQQHQEGEAEAMEVDLVPATKDKALPANGAANGAAPAVAAVSHVECPVSTYVTPPNSDGTASMDQPNAPNNPSEVGASNNGCGKRGRDDEQHQHQQMMDTDSGNGNNGNRGAPAPGAVGDGGGGTDGPAPSADLPHPHPHPHSAPPDVQMSGDEPSSSASGNKGGGASADRENEAEPLPAPKRPKLSASEDADQPMMGSSESEAAAGSASASGMNGDGLSPSPIPSPSPPPPDKPDDEVMQQQEQQQQQEPTESAPPAAAPAPATAAAAAAPPPPPPPPPPPRHAVFGPQLPPWWKRDKDKDKDKDKEKKDHDEGAKSPRAAPLLSLNTTAATTETDGVGVGAAAEGGGGDGGGLGVGYRRLTIPRALQEVFWRLQRSSSPASTWRLMGAFGWTARQASVQNDTQELNRLLFDALDDKPKILSSIRLKRAKIEGAGEGQRVVQTDGEEPLSINALFQGETENVIECVDVCFTSRRTETFLDIQLNVEGSKDVYESIKKYTEEEILDGAEKYDAGPQHGKQKAKKYIRITKLPPVLQLHLKRFRYAVTANGAHDMVKVNDRFEYPATLDLSSLIPSADPSLSTYHLHAVLVHQGEIFGGHYYAFIRPSGDGGGGGSGGFGGAAGSAGTAGAAGGGGWLKFNDQIVHRTCQVAATEEQYGGDGLLKCDYRDLTAAPPTYKLKNSAYVLQYVQAGNMAAVLGEVSPSEVLERSLQEDAERIDEWRKRGKQRNDEVNLVKLLTADGIRRKIYEHAGPQRMPAVQVSTFAATCRSLQTSLCPDRGKTDPFWSRPYRELKAPYVHVNPNLPNWVMNTLRRIAPEEILTLDGGNHESVPSWEVSNFVEYITQTRRLRTIRMPGLDLRLIQQTSPKDPRRLADALASLPDLEVLDLSSPRTHLTTPFLNRLGQLMSRKSLDLSESDEADDSGSNDTQGNKKMASHKKGGGAASVSGASVSTASPSGEGASAAAAAAAAAAGGGGLGVGGVKTTDATRGSGKDGAKDGGRDGGKDESGKSKGDSEMPTDPFPKLRVLKLAEIEAPYQGMAKLLKGIRSAQLDVLDLSGALGGRWIMPRDKDDHRQRIEAIEEALEELLYRCLIRELDLSRNSYHVDIFRVVSSALRHNDNRQYIRSLRLGWNAFGRRDQMGYFLAYVCDHLQLTHLDLRGVDVLDLSGLDNNHGLLQRLWLAFMKAQKERDEQLAHDKHRRHKKWEEWDAEAVPPPKDEQEAKRRREALDKRAEAAAKEEAEILKTPPLVIDLRENDLVCQGGPHCRWPTHIFEAIETLRNLGYTQPWIRTELLQPSDLYQDSIDVYDQLEEYALNVPRYLIDILISTYDPMHPHTWLQQVQHYANDLGELYHDAYMHDWTANSDSQWGQDDGATSPMDYGRYRLCLDGLKRLGTESTLHSIRAAITQSKIDECESLLEVYRLSEDNNLGALMLPGPGAVVGGASVLDNDQNEGSYAYPIGRAPIAGWDQDIGYGRGGRQADDQEDDDESTSDNNVPVAQPAGRSGVLGRGGRGRNRGQPNNVSGSIVELQDALIHEVGRDRGGSVEDVIQIPDTGADNHRGQNPRRLLPPHGGSSEYRGEYRVMHASAAAYRYAQPSSTNARGRTKQTSPSQVDPQHQHQHRQQDRRAAQLEGADDADDEDEWGEEFEDGDAEATLHDDRMAGAEYSSGSGGSMGGQADEDGGNGYEDLEQHAQDADEEGEGDGESVDSGDQPRVGVGQRRRWRPSVGGLSAFEGARLDRRRVSDMSGYEGMRLESLERRDHPRGESEGNPIMCEESEGEGYDEEEEDEQDDYDEEEGDAEEGEEGADADAHAHHHNTRGGAGGAGGAADGRQRAMDLDADHSRDGVVGEAYDEDLMEPDQHQEEQDGQEEGMEEEEEDDNYEAEAMDDQHEHDPAAPQEEQQNNGEPLPLHDSGAVAPDGETVGYADDPAAYTSQAAGLPPPYKP
ncbi:unnamed protein product [Vitrella brassicaformis CCMP3155]|uniref:USP domain-containing protein n=7 Tax=Vitrella brassicaformis TaxID=1169539 RepID=A0A0G4EB37_VITBC|nr:unnamed protein product [Vitrella brassicaformis CCMP3155]|eukprot:CEL92910.1 unnamed protein product [Vitrella brassicaformis CCMP3155]